MSNWNVFTDEEKLIQRIYDEIDRLLPDETPIVLEYVKRLIASRPEGRKRILPAGKEDHMSNLDHVYQHSKNPTAVKEKA